MQKTKGYRNRKKNKRFKIDPIVYTCIDRCFIKKRKKIQNYSKKISKNCRKA